MKNILCCLLLLSAIGYSAVEGLDHGPLSVFVFVQPGSLPGVPGMNGEPVTVVWLTCSDANATAVRARMTYTDGSGEHEVVFLSDLSFGRGIIVTSTPRKSITKMRFTLLYDGPTIE
jgi:hypothetical protein